MKRFFSALSVTLLVASQIGALALHVYTIVMLFGLYGIVVAVIAFCLPILSEIFCFFKSISVAECFLNTYTLSAFSLIGGFIFSFICSVLSEHIEDTKVKEMGNNEVIEKNNDVVGSTNSEFDTMFANMDILELEDIVRNKQSQYRPEVYSVACKCFNERYNANPDIILQAKTQNTLDEIDVKRQKPMKWYYWVIYFWIPISIINVFRDLFTNNGYANLFVLDVDLVLIGLLIVSEIFIIQKKRKGLWFFASFLIAEIILLLIIALVDMSAENLGSMLGFMIFSIMNYVYFYKRWHLFN